jgi:hypothetical protein
MKVEDIVGELIMQQLAKSFTRKGEVKLPIGNVISNAIDQRNDLLQEPELDTSIDDEQPSSGTSYTF